MSDHIGNTLVCETTTHYFFCCFVCYLFVALCLYFLCKKNYFGLDLPTPGYQHLNRCPIPIPIHTHMRHLLSLCRLLLRRMLTPECFHLLSASCCVKSRLTRVRAKNRRSCRASFRVLPFEVLRESVSPSLFFCATDSL